jgi:hypothetical protein
MANEELEQAEAHLKQAEADLEAAQSAERNAEHKAEEAVHDIREAESLEQAADHKAEEALHEIHEAESEEHAAEHEIEKAVREVHEAEERHHVTILVNGEPHEETETRISFEEVVKVAYPVPPSGTCIEYTMTYRNGPPANPKGTLTVGHSVEIGNRMIFDVTPTDRS